MLRCVLPRNCFNDVPVFDPSKDGDHAPRSAAGHLGAWKSGIECSGDQLIASIRPEAALGIGEVGLKKKFARKT